jgi:hypothetical protein
MMWAMEATHIVHWPGNDVLACDEHTAKLKRLAEVMGFKLSTTPCDRVVECGNCESSWLRTIESFSGSEVG